MSLPHTVPLHNKTPDEEGDVEPEPELVLEEDDDLDGDDLLADAPELEIEEQAQPDASDEGAIDESADQELLEADFADFDEPDLELDLGDDPLLEDEDASDVEPVSSQEPQMGDVEHPSQQLDDYPELELDEPFSSEAEQQLSEAMAQEGDEELDLSSDLDGDLDDELSALMGDSLDDDIDGDEQLDDSQLDEDFLADLTQTDFDALLNELAEPDEDVIGEPQDNDLDLQSLLADSDFDADDDAVADANEDDSGAAEPDYLDIDDLLEQSDDSEPDNEPYDEVNMDVGLGEFDDMLDDSQKTDVDSEDGGFSAKLDLARAYIEIDDVDSALEALQDVLDNGPQSLHKEAQALQERLKR
ncbi:FimV/HubP family polar landmark protein [Pseudoalteromonas ruthenica]|uniref:FimV/HubP family polar landmark protein n=1 Tax=Pseudoalteromonas ruthenica TaxID=151081 RepID=UPI00110B6C4A|nr:FimV/HubP family polar landmark protein [Pseudoalteromonas ruthenica]